MSLVKTGTIFGYEGYPIGKTFDASFDNPSWEHFESNKGAQVVEFNGAINQSTHDAATALLLSNSPEAIWEFIMAYAIEKGDDTYCKDDLEY